MKKIKLLMINYEYPPLGGGAGIANRNLLKAFSARDDIQADLLTSFAGSGVSEEAFSENIRLVKVGIEKKELHKWRKKEVVQWLWRAGSVHKDMIEKGSYDLSHCFFAFPSGLPAWQRRSKLGYIISLRGSDVPGYNSSLGLDYILLSGLFKRIWGSADRIAANSKGLKTLAEKFYSSSPIEVIPNGVDRDLFPPAERAFNSSRLKLLMVARLTHRKRVDIAIESLSLLVQMGVDAELNIAGTGELTTELKRLTAERKLHNRVNFLGAVDHSRLAEVYSENHIYLMCSENEGMSNSVLEAISTGMPIVSSDCQGSEELIKQNGLLVRSQNPKIYADCINKIYSSPELYRSMCHEAENIANHYSIHAAGEQYVRLYRQTLQQ
ncbi:glycosyltransferase family 4 protein [Sedimentisphaera salicampi]|uniref:Glycosyltransferase KanE n=1 Tax=Sedimentisphaera salicampi TaxID=1941349 RepID=A0A1W6LQD0_9BACT|nr:glycosyltransferase family 4 protein [Sedimentisphaera salicampi]ARN57933.1 Glycosyltransferase KanE [Sedimentisphaera salicampi]